MRNSCFKALSRLSHQAARTPAQIGQTETALRRDDLGCDLARDGSEGVMSFRATPEKGIEITKLSLSGEAMSHPQEPCLVDLTGEKPIQTTFRGQPNGASRYEAQIPVCPFLIEVLEGAVLVTSIPRACEFAEARCRVDPVGLWGPRGDSFGPAEAKQNERELSRAESDMRVNFRALQSSIGNDREAVKKIAGEQAGFSSAREMTCRTYLKEDFHEYCALRLTQARALALQAAIFEQGKSKGGFEAGKSARKAHGSQTETGGKAKAGHPRRGKSGS